MYSRYNIPKNYSGNRFKEQFIETETKMHKPSPSYMSTRTSVSPTFQNALNEQYDNKTSQSVYDFEENATDSSEVESEISSLNFQDEIKATLGTSEKNAEPEKKKGPSATFSELVPFISKLTANISYEDLILISLILLFISEENSESKNLLLPLLLLFLYK